jgi:transcriptional regulator with XRE-family HTH domain
MERPWVTSPTYEAAIRALVKARTDTGVSQAELADRLGKSRSFVTKIEHRERRVDVVEFVAIARALGYSPSEMMAFIDAELSEPLEF